MDPGKYYRRFARFSRCCTVTVYKQAFAVGHGSGMAATDGVIDLTVFNTALHTAEKVSNIII